MNNVLENINNYNKNRDKKVLIIFDDMIADIMRSEKFKAIVEELFIRCRKLNISIVFIAQSYFRTPGDARLNITHYIIMKIGNKKELKIIDEENSGHLDFKEFLKIYNYCTRKEQYKILDDKIESNVNQYKVDRLNAETSAFSSGDLNKYEFLKRIDLNYKPNAFDKARFEFSPLGKIFST